MASWRPGIPQTGITSFQDEDGAAIEGFVATTITAVATIHLDKGGIGTQHTSWEPSILSRILDHVPADKFRRMPTLELNRTLDRG